jgi:hypothetical protein
MSHASAPLSPRDNLEYRRSHHCDQCGVTSAAETRDRRNCPLSRISGRYGRRVNPSGKRGDLPHELRTLENLLVLPIHDRLMLERAEQPDGHEERWRVIHGIRSQAPAVPDVLPRRHSRRQQTDAHDGDAQCRGPRTTGRVTAPRGSSLRHRRRLSSNWRGGSHAPRDEVVGSRGSWTLV